ncbi:MAG: Nif3-like dinuclear metal center hexameric protein, partial [Clostridia bacterium]|nr:Nif3-like dinuclear metal center hexameric protein [Clostridia bacterium]
FLDAANRGITLIDGGHFATENTVIAPLKNLLSVKFPTIKFLTNHTSVIR